MVYRLNPMTGARLDLEVSAEDPGVAEERWRVKRIAYLHSLLPTASDDARPIYLRELRKLEPKPAQPAPAEKLGLATAARPYDGMLKRRDDGRTKSSAPRAGSGAARGRRTTAGAERRRADANRRSKR